MPFNSKDLKSDLVHLIKASNKRTKKLMLLLRGLAMRLCACQLLLQVKPIEMAWATVKNYIRTNNKTEVNDSNEADEMSYINEQVMEVKSEMIDFRW